MEDTSGSKDKALEALDFIINVLKEHEKTLDKSIDELATVSEQINDTANGLKGKVDKVEEKINNLQKEVTTLIGTLSNAPKALPIVMKEQELQAQKAPSGSTPIVEDGPSVILRCKDWEDFKVLTRQAQTLFFSYKEGEKVLRADGLKGKQIITYSGALPNLSAILKTWLSRQLDITEQNILEGFLDKPE